MRSGVEYEHCEVEARVWAVTFCVPQRGDAYKVLWACSTHSNVHTNRNFVHFKEEPTVLCIYTIHYAIICLTSRYGTLCNPSV